MAAAVPLTHRFPLVARRRPPCGPVATRIAHLNRLACQADATTASAVYNQAALLASDIGQAELARQWCRAHASAYLRARPAGAQAARSALEPLVNLARLHIRDGNGDRAKHLLDDLYQAITHRRDTIIDSLDVPAERLTATPEVHQQLRQWLWKIQLADGTRALTSAGRWQEALTHVRAHTGIGATMLDGRQVAVLAHATAADVDTALQLLHATTPGEPWHNAVTACLIVLCQRMTGSVTGRHLEQMLDRYRRLDLTTAELAVFHTRLGLTVIDAAGGVQQASGRRVAEDLIAHLAEAGDGYAVRDLLAHDGCATLLTPSQTRALTGIVNDSGLGRQEVPADLMASLTDALATCHAVLSRALAADAPGVP